MAKRIKDLDKITTVNDSDCLAIDTSDNTKSIKYSNFSNQLTTSILSKSQEFKKTLLFGSTKLGEEVASTGYCTANTSWISNIAMTQSLSSTNEYNWTVTAEQSNTVYYKQGGLRWYFQLLDDWTKYDELLVVFGLGTLNNAVQYSKLDVRVMQLIAAEMKAAYPYNSFGQSYFYRRSINLYNQYGINWMIELVASYDNPTRFYYATENSYLHAIYGLKY